MGCQPSHMLGYEIDKPSKILIKISNAMEYIECDIQNTEPPGTNGHIILYVWENILTRFYWSNS